MLSLSAGVAFAPRPHLVTILADDLGWHDTSIRNPNAPTPTIANLSASGLLLERHYTFRFCSPSRRSFLSGRSPLAITTVQPDGNHTCSDFLPLATTTIAEKLTSVGYACHFIGKGHLGYETTDHLPANRGFRSHVGYLLGAEKYEHGCLAGSGACSADPSTGAHDFWENDAPATSEVPRSRDRQGERRRVRDGEPRQRDAREVHEAGAGALGRVYWAVLRAVRSGGRGRCKSFSTSHTHA